MSFDSQLDAAINEPTADADASQNAGTAPAAQEQPASQPTQTYTRRDIDAAYAEARRWARDERARIEQELRQEYARQSQPQPERNPALSQLDEYVRGMLEQQTAPIRQQMTEVALDRAIGDLGRRFPEFSDDHKLAEILTIVTERGLDRATHLSIPDVLELAHAYWLRGQPKPDIDAIKRQAALEAQQKLIDRKVTTSNRTPRTEGTGGSAPLTPRPKTLKRGEFDAAIEAALSRTE